jgi:hypothetical protein
MVAVRMADENDLDKSNGKAVEPFWNAHTPERSTVDAVRTEKSVAAPFAAAPTRTPAANPKSVPHLNQSKAQEAVMPASGVSLMSKAKGDF